MIEGPGAGSTFGRNVSPVPARLATIPKSLGGLIGSFDTQRILLLWSAAGGAVSGLPNSTPSMSPFLLNTWALPEPSPVKPVRAHAGSAPVSILVTHGWVSAGGDAARCGFSLQAPSRSTGISTAADRFIERSS